MKLRYSIKRAHCRVRGHRLDRVFGVLELIYADASVERRCGVTNICRRCGCHDGLDRVTP